MAVKVTYTTSDGTVFDNKLDAELHENRWQHAKQNDLIHWLETSYAGKELLKQHKLTDVGLWHVTGEDPNCDFGGPHYTPSIGYFEGTLKEALEFGLASGKFFTWGYGGGAVKVEVHK